MIIMVWLHKQRFGSVFFLQPLQVLRWFSKAHTEEVWFGCRRRHDSQRLWTSFLFIYIYFFFTSILFFFFTASFYKGRHLVKLAVGHFPCPTNSDETTANEGPFFRSPYISSVRPHFSASQSRFLHTHVYALSDFLMLVNVFALKLVLANWWWYNFHDKLIYAKQHASFCLSYLSLIKKIKKN